MNSGRTADQDDAGPSRQKVTNEAEAYLTRVYELKSELQRSQDAKVTNEGIDELVDTITDSTSSRILLRTAYSTLIAVLSNIQARSIPDKTVDGLYKLLAEPPNDQDDEHRLSKLKICELAIAKSSQKPDKHDLEAIIRNVARACFYGVREQPYQAIPRRNAAPTTRIQTHSSGSMGQFSLNTPVMPNKHGRSRKGSTSSIRSRGSARSLAALDSDSSETDTGRASVRDSTAIRLEGLRVLAALAKLDARALHPFWPLFLGPSSDPSLFTLAQSDLSLIVRLQAIQTTRSLLMDSKGYLDLARESKSQLAFTPLSHTLASIANDINIQTVKLLRICFSLLQAADMLVAALQLTCVVIANTPHARLSQAHLDAIVRVVLDNVARIEQAACISAITTTLNAAADIGSVQLEDDRAARALRDLLDRASAASKGSKEPSEELLWLLLASLSRLSPSRERSARVEQEIIVHIVDTFVDTPCAVQDAYLKALAGLNKPNNSHGIRKGLESLLDNCNQLQSPSIRAQIAALACQDVTIMRSKMEDLLKIIRPLAASTHAKDVRSQAVRTLGVILQSDAVIAHPERGRQCFVCLEETVEDSAPPAIRAEAMWNLANAVDGRNVDILSQSAQERILRRAIAQSSSEGASRDAEMIRTSSIRMIGALLARLTDLEITVKEKGRASLINALLHGTAKAQWNAATAMTRLIKAGEASEAVVAALLTTFFTSENIKVRTSVVHALEALEEQTSAYDDQLEARLAHSVSQTLENRQDMTYDQVAKAKTLDDTLRQLLARLSIKRKP